MTQTGTGGAGVVGATKNVAIDPAYQKLEGHQFESALGNLSRGEIIQEIQACDWLGLYRHRQTGEIKFGLVPIEGTDPNRAA
jgi:hypothetical protein